MFERIGPSWAEVAQLLPPVSGIDDGFGADVAIDGDTIIVAAPGNDALAADSGRVYVYRENGGSWTLEAELVPNDPAVDKSFGSSIDIAGDTIVIGANGDDAACVGVTACNSGSAYVFDRTGTSWSQTTKLLPVTSFMSDLFGTSVAINDGTIMIGVPGRSTTGLFSGICYVFDEVLPDTWFETSTIEPIDLNVLSLFGSAISLDGDQALIGAVGDDDGCFFLPSCNAGAAYVFTRSSTTVWAQEDKLVAGDPETQDFFGTTLHIDGDRAFVGAPRDDDRGIDSGSVYGFTRGATAWSEVEKHTAITPGDSHEFGIMLAFEDQTLVVGSPGPVALSATPPPFVFIDNGAVNVIRLTDLADRFCNGDGGDQMGCTFCPCGNGTAPGTIGGCTNAAGTSARLLRDGCASTTRDALSFGLIGGNPASFGVLASADNRLPANPANPCFGVDSGVQSATLDGLRCVGGSLVRHGARPIDTNGDVGVTANGWGTLTGAANSIVAQGGFTAGQTRHFQCFYREDELLVCLTGQNTSNAISGHDEAVTLSVTSSASKSSWEK